MPRINKEPIVKPVVKLVGNDGNAYAIMGQVQRALIDIGQYDQVVRYMAEVTDRDYHHLLATTLDYVEVE